MVTRGPCATAEGGTWEMPGKRQGGKGTKQEQGKGRCPHQGRQVACSPALVATDHVAVVVGEATDAASDVGPIAAVLGGAECGATGRLVLGARHKQALAGTYQDRRGRGWRRGWGPRAVVVVLKGRREEPLSAAGRW